MPIIDRIIPQDAGTIEAGSTINKSQQILDEEEALATKKRRLAEQGVGTKPSVALPEIPKADKPEKVLDADGRVKHIDHGDKIRVPFTSMIGIGKAAATRREQFVGEALDKMAERVGPDRNLKISGNRVFIETAIKHAVAKGIPLECPDQKWQKEYERALSQTPKQKLAFGVAGSVAAGSVRDATPAPTLLAATGESTVAPKKEVAQESAGAENTAGKTPDHEKVAQPDIVKPGPTSAPGVEKTVEEPAEPEKAQGLPTVKSGDIELRAGDYVRIRYLETTGDKRGPVLDVSYVLLDPPADLSGNPRALRVNERDGVHVLNKQLQSPPLHMLGSKNVPDNMHIVEHIPGAIKSISDLENKPSIATVHLNQAISANTRTLGVDAGQQRSVTGEITGISADRKTLEVTQAGRSRRVIDSHGQPFPVEIQPGARGKISVDKTGTISFEAMAQKRVQEKGKGRASTEI